MKSTYFKTAMLMQQSFNLFLSIIDKELRVLGFNDISASQAIIVYNLGEKELTVRELGKTCYSGTNVSYALESLVKNGYMMQQPHQQDKRYIFVKLTPKGMDLCHHLEHVLDEHEKSANFFIKKESVDQCYEILGQLRTFLSSKTLAHSEL